MSDLIDRQAAQRLFGKALTYKERNGKLTWTTSEVKQWLADCTEQLPPAQPEIIRCKDCKHHWTHKRMDSMPIERCDLEQTFYDVEHDFCSLAERRTDVWEEVKK